MNAKQSVWIGFGLLACACTSHTYEIRGPDATRAVAALGKSAPSDSESVVVRGRHLKQDREVWVELYRSDLVWPDERAEVQAGHVSPRWEPIPISDIAPEENVRLLRFTKNPRRSTTFLSIGGGILGGGLLLSIPVAAATGDTAYLIPLYGAMDATIDAFRAAASACDPRTDRYCGLSNTLSAFVGVLHMLVFIIDATGTTLIAIGLAIPEDDRQRPPPRKLETSDLLPVISPYSDAGLMLTWRF